MPLAREVTISFPFLHIQKYSIETEYKVSYL